LGCYSYIDRRNQKKELSLKAYKKIIDELLKSGVDTMVISGGEPLLREDLYLICKYAKENGITMLQVISNGTMPISKYDRIIPYIDKLTISLDGFESGVSYIRDAGIMPNIEKTINHCKKLVETTFVATLNKKNLHLQSKYDELSKKLGVEFNFSLLTVKADEIFEELLVRKDDFVKMLDQYQEAEDNSVKTEKICECTLECKKSCGAGKSMISISASGNVYPCHMLHQEELCMGNILEENLISLVNSEKNYLKNWTVEDKIQCKDCQYRYLCGGGCHARAYFENGDFCGKDSTCVVTKYGLHRYFKYIKSVYNTL
jgi:radical SAM protein with 4Fe4S-binding SPASM domain